VARTDDTLPFERPLIERAAVVRADVLYALNPAADVTEQNLARVSNDAPGRARRDFGNLGDAMPSHAPR
jgi:hypothetical protein